MGQSVDLVQVLLDVGVGERVVHQVACEEFVVRGHVDEAMSREIEQDDFFFTCFLALVGLADGGGDGVARFGRRDDAFDTGK